MDGAAQAKAATPTDALTIRTASAQPGGLLGSPQLAGPKGQLTKPVKPAAGGGDYGARRVAQQGKLEIQYAYLELAFM